MLQMGPTSLPYTPRPECRTATTYSVYNLRRIPQSRVKKPHTHTAPEACVPGQHSKAAPTWCSKLRTTFEISPDEMM